MAAPGNVKVVVATRSFQDIHMKTEVYLKDMDADQTVALAHELATNTTLKKLWLHGYIRDVGVAAVAQALETNTTLKFLGLNSARVGDTGATALARALKVNSSLTTLSLNANHIGEDGAAAIAEALQTNATLQVLGLDLNGIGDRGAASFASCLKQNKSLKSIYLGSNKISDEGARTMLKVIEFRMCKAPLLPALTTMTREGNKISESVDRALGAALAKRQKIREATTLRANRMRVLVHNYLQFTPSLGAQFWHQLRLAHIATIPFRPSARSAAFAQIKSARKRAARRAKRAV
jgi:Leucine Rich repeat